MIKNLLNFHYSRTENADCYVVNSREQCYCQPGFLGDPYSGCKPPPRSVCEPNPCAPNGQCIVQENGEPICFCPFGMAGDPTTTGCHGYECRADSDCSEYHACLGFRCRDPCAGSCGIGARCKVEKHHPVCYCDNGLEGDPLVRCYQSDEPQKSPCWPSPCGRGTQCNVLNDRAVCSCLPDFIGDPQTGCHPECVINSDCPADKACINTRCENPCQASTCGINARCSGKFSNFQ